jgi:hypothetical protein
MQLLYPALATGFFLVAAPLLIHLIHMVRQRRQPWAAMEFLLAAYRRQRKWILLRQLLLLLARTAAIAVLVAMLAGWVSNQQWLSWFGEQTSHYICVLDDSQSMADRSGGQTAYSRGLDALEGLERQLVATPGSHRLTILRASRAAVLSNAPEAGQRENADAAVDVNAQTVSPSSRLLERLRASQPTDLGMSLDSALDLVPALAESVSADRTQLLLFSDMRQQQWERPERTIATLQGLQRQGIGFQVVDCAAEPQANLSIVELAPEPDVWAAGVPVMIRVAVSNNSQVPARNVILSAAVIQMGDTSSGPILDRSASGNREALPDTAIEQIEPGATEVRRFQVFVPAVGTHAVEVTLPDDALSQDNRRVCLVPLVDQRKVLLVDGDPTGRQALLLASALQPGGTVRTGLACDTQPASFLNNISLDRLRLYDAIYLLDVPTFDSSFGPLLRIYLNEGHGCAIWLGPRARLEAYEQVLGAENVELLPGAFGQKPLAEDAQERAAPDLRFGDPHPITEPLAAGGDAIFSRIRVGRFVPFLVAADEVPEPQTVLKIRGGSPLLVLRQVESGNIAWLSAGLDSASSNWPTDPTFVIVMLRLAAHLTTSLTAPTGLPVGETWQIACDQERMNPRAVYVPPADQPPRMEYDLPAQVIDSTLGSQWRISSRDALLENTVGLDAMLRAGLAELWIQEVDGSRRVQLMAWTSPAEEGRLARVARSDFAQKMSPLSIRWSDAAAFSGDQGSGGATRSMWLLAVLGGLLIGEQVLGYLASYHPPRIARGQP